MARKNISIGLDTWQELAALGRFGMTFDDIVKIMLTEHRELDKLRSRLKAQEVEPEQAIRELFNEVDKVTPPAGYYRAAFGATKSRQPQTQPQTQRQRLSSGNGIREAITAYIEATKEFDPELYKSLKQKLEQEAQPVSDNIFEQDTHDIESEAKGSRRDENKEMLDAFYKATQPKSKEEVAAEREKEQES